LLLVGLVSTACEKPDASFTTSPSVRALIGQTSGNVSYAPAVPSPAEVAAPHGWRVDVGSARFSTLERGEHAIQVVMQISTQPGASMEVWLERDGEALVRWSGGSSVHFNGTLCFQVLLAEKGEALPLAGGKETLVLAFRDPGTEQLVVARRMPVAGVVPSVTGAIPGPGSRVFRDLLGCPRSVI
jgi:hypothetical protein